MVESGKLTSTGTAPSNVVPPRRNGIQPVPPENVDAMRDVRQSTKTPICCGENLFLRHGFREILDGKCDEMPEQAFMLVGTIDDAREKAERLSRGA